MTILIRIAHLFSDAEVLRREHNPDFLYIHPMGIDDIGHRYGGSSKEYRGKVMEADSILASLLPPWMEQGYEIVITSDHGMSDEGQHGGITAEEREVPFFILSSTFEPDNYSEVMPQLAVAPLICRLLGIPGSAIMKATVFQGSKP